MKKIQLNTDLLPILNVDTYWSNNFVDDYDITREQLDEVIQDIAPKYIKELITKCIPSAEVYVTGVYHPSEYNNGGDELDFEVAIDDKDYNNFKQAVSNDELFDGFLQSSFKSSDGYMNLMANNIKEFEAEDEDRQLAQMLMFKIPADNIIVTQDSYDSELFDNISSNYDIQDMDTEDDLDEAKEIVPPQDELYGTEFIQLYQMNPGEENHGYIFSGLDFQDDKSLARSNYTNPANWNMDVAYDEGIYGVLDDIFAYGNSDDFHDRFTARSISVSDIIKYKGNYYFVEPMGFELITDRLDEDWLQQKPTIEEDCTQASSVDGGRVSIFGEKEKKLNEDAYDDMAKQYAEDEEANAKDYKARVKGNITDTMRTAFKAVKDVLDTGSYKDVEVNGFYFPEETVLMVKSALKDGQYHLNASMDLNISDILNMIEDNDSIEAAIDELFADYDANSAFSWADNFITILSRIDTTIPNNEKAYIEDAVKDIIGEMNDADDISEEDINNIVDTIIENHLDVDTNSPEFNELVTDLVQNTLDYGLEESKKITEVYCYNLKIRNADGNLYDLFFKSNDKADNLDAVKDLAQKSDSLSQDEKEDADFAEKYEILPEFVYDDIVGKLKKTEAKEKANWIIDGYDALNKTEKAVVDMVLWSYTGDKNDLEAITANAIEHWSNPEDSNEKLEPIDADNVKTIINKAFNNLDSRISTLKLMDKAARCINDEDIFAIWLSTGVPDEASENDYEDIALHPDMYNDIVKSFDNIMHMAKESGGLYNCSEDALQLAKEYEPNIENYVDGHKVDEAKWYNDCNYNVKITLDGEHETFYTPWAESKEDAKNKALQMAKRDLSVESIRNNGNTYSVTVKFYIGDGYSYKDYDFIEADNEEQAKDEALRRAYLDLKVVFIYRESKKINTKNENKKLIEGPGAGYTILGSIDNAKVFTYEVSSEKEINSNGEKEININCDIDVELYDLDFSSYDYGGKINFPVEAKVVGITMRTGEYDEELPDVDMQNIKESLDGITFKALLGAGWSHVKFTGLFNAETEGDVYAPFCIDNVTLEISNKTITEFIDNKVAGSLDKSTYEVQNKNGDLMSTFDDEDKALDYAKENNASLVVKVYHDYSLIDADGSEDDDPDYDIIWSANEGDEIDESKKLNEAGGVKAESLSDDTLEDMNKFIKKNNLDPEKYKADIFKIRMKDVPPQEIAGIVTTYNGKEYGFRYLAGLDMWTVTLISTGADVSLRTYDNLGDAIDDLSNIDKAVNKESFKVDKMTYQFSNLQKAVDDVYSAKDVESLKAVITNIEGLPDEDMADIIDRIDNNLQGNYDANDFDDVQSMVVNKLQKSRLFTESKDRQIKTEASKNIETKKVKIGSHDVEIEVEDGNHIRKIWWNYDNNKSSTGFNYDEEQDKFVAFEWGNFLRPRQNKQLLDIIHKIVGNKDAKKEEAKPINFEFGRYSGIMEPNGNVTYNIGTSKNNTSHKFHYDEIDDTPFPHTNNQIVKMYLKNNVLKNESLKDYGIKPSNDFFQRIMNALAKELDISQYDVQKEADAIKFRYNGKVYFAEPASMYQIDVFDDNHNQIGWGVSINDLKAEVFTDYNDEDYIYELVGGEYAGTYTRAEAEKLPIKEPELSPDDSEIRNNGGFTHRKELDNQLQFMGYLGPMWNGIANGKPVIRYETQEVYDQLSEAKFKDKVKAIKRSLKKNDKRLSDETAQASAERIAGSMIKNED